MRYGAVDPPRHIVWGIIHGASRVLGDITENTRHLIFDLIGTKRNRPYYAVFQVIVTFVIVCFAWIFFRANNTSELLLILKNLFTTFGASTFASELGLTLNGAFIMIFAIIIMVLSDRKLTLAQYTAPSGAKLFGGTSLYLLWAIIFAWLILLASNGSSAFIYFQF